MTTRARVRDALEDPITQVITLVVTALSLVLLVVVGFYTVNLNSQELRQQRTADTRLQCIAAWANATTARTAHLAPLVAADGQALQDRSDALNNLLRAALRKDQAAILRLETAWIKAGDRYTRIHMQYLQALKASPVPAAPQFACK